VPLDNPGVRSPAPSIQVGPRSSKGMRGRLMSESNLTLSILVPLLLGAEWPQESGVACQGLLPGQSGLPLPSLLTRTYPAESTGAEFRVWDGAAVCVLSGVVRLQVLRSRVTSCSPTRSPARTKVGDQCRPTGLSAQSGGI
jgi:hypothetical protein